MSKCVPGQSIGNGSYHQVVDREWSGWYYGSNVANSWIQFDFKDKGVWLESYTIKSDGNDVSDKTHLREWEIQGSNDASFWKKLDSRNTNDLNGKYVTQHFTCSEKRKEAFRYIRLIQTGRNMSESHELRFSEIEFFGSIVSNE